jgi:hypothetical protein
MSHSSVKARGKNMSVTLFVLMRSINKLHVSKSQLLLSAPEPTPDQSPEETVAFAPAGSCSDML